GLYLARDPRRLPGAGRVGRANRCAHRETARAARARYRRRLCRPDRARPLRVRLRHGLERPWPQPDIHLRTGGTVVSEVALALIGGTGLYRLAALEDVRRRAVATPYGPPSGEVIEGTLAGRQVLFLARHGEAHDLAPHEVNYRANLW